MTTRKGAESESLLVAGSAGFVGKNLMRHLADQGRPAVSLYHARLPDPLAHILPVFADMMQPGHMSSSLRHARCVIHLAWSQSFLSHWEENFWPSEGPRQDSRNMTMVKNLVQAMEESGTRRIIFLSALGASRQAQSWYLQEKYYAEAVILNSRIPEKIIVRSPLVFGDIINRDRLVAAVSRLMHFPWFYPVPRYREMLGLLHVDDLSEILIKLSEVRLEEAAQLIELAPGENLPIEDVFRLVSQGIGKGTHWALTGLLGQALTPVFERIQRRQELSTPVLRDLLTIGHRRDRAAEINNPFLDTLPPSRPRFQESMTGTPTQH